jgi:hypothetical protein
LKTTAYSQGIHAISPVAKEKIGTLRVLEDGRKFRYSKAGATALAAGKTTVAAAIVAAHINATVAATNSSGTQVTLTITAGTAIAENALAGGYLQISEGTLLGRSYRVDSNTAVTAAGTSITLSLADRLVGYSGTTRVTLVHNPFSGTIISATPEALPAGIPPVDVTANYFYWSQTGGIACALCTGTPAVGTMLTHGAVDGSVGAINTTLDIDQAIIGIQAGIVGVDTKYKTIFLTIE